MSCSLLREIHCSWTKTQHQFFQIQRRNSENHWDSIFDSEGKNFSITSLWKPYHIIRRFIVSKAIFWVRKPTRGKSLFPNDCDNYKTRGVTMSTEVRNMIFRQIIHTFFLRSLILIKKFNWRIIHSRFNQYFYFML